MSHRIEIVWDEGLEGKLRGLLAVLSAEPETLRPQEPAEPWMWNQWKKAEDARLQAAVMKIKTLLESSSVDVIDLEVLQQCAQLVVREPEK